MIYNKNWLTHEMFLINQSVKQHEKSKHKHKEDTIFMIKFLVLIGIVLSGYLVANETYLRCPHCEEVIELKVKPGKWVCPSCGYENMNEIRYCPLCGSERQ